jgi:hypothetical protein
MNENRTQSNFPRIVEAVKRRSDGAVLLTGVLVALIAAALAAPRATEPDALSLPLPTPDRAHLHALARAERERAVEARRHALSFTSRSVGEMLRRVGEAEGRANSNVSAAVADLRALARRALRDEGPGGLLALRSVQSELFVSAARAWTNDGTPDGELRELGGDFAELATKSGWREGHALALTDEELALLFRMRWSDLTGLGDKPPFATTLDEYRERYALLLRHPSGADARVRLERQLGYVTALEKLDPDYPATFARGVLFYWAGAYDASAAAFRAHLATHPNGRWTLRAKNHLLAALAPSKERD